MLRTVKLMQTPAIGSAWVTPRAHNQVSKKGSDHTDDSTETDETDETDHTDDSTETDETDETDDIDEVTPSPITAFSTVDGCIYQESSPKYAYMGEDDDMYIQSFSDAYADAFSDMDTDEGKKPPPVTSCMFVYRIRRTHTYPDVEFLMAPPPPTVENTEIGAVWQPRTSGWIKLANYVPPATDTDTHAVNACTEQLLATYPGTSMDAYRFRGFLNPVAPSTQTTTRTLHVVFVATSSAEDQDRWAILDEIMYLKRWRGTDVDPEFAACLNHYTFLTEIVATAQSEQSSTVPPVPSVPLPMCMYMVQYQSSSSSSNQSESEASPAWSVVSPPIDATSEHPWFGDQWYFTPPRAVVEDAESEPSPVWRRYAVFPEDSDGGGAIDTWGVRETTVDVLFRDLRDLTDEDRTYLTETYHSPRSRTTGDWPCRSTFFYEHGWPIWCIRDRHAFTRM